MQGWIATAGMEWQKKKHGEIKKGKGKLFRKNLQLIGVC